ncbi:MAG: PIG-L family deacetylase [Anaerolineae bacterium]|nr:PIG-L family deacetylase [Anaerolineae bacterium]MBL8106979.1 PIG-L family deacetylase [Anaerolineales bacterium]MCC7188080.1 PIG-L family deacetylase [Anaerolineales bacterium]
MADKTNAWETSQKILVILAHPDDPEFFCGASLAKWARAGHEITYLLLTCGDKGFNPTTQPDMTTEKLCALRHVEQRNAANVIGAKAVHFLDVEDGYLTPNLDLRRDIVREIRRHKPDILVTCDPQNLFAMYGLNHPDHRACGQVVLDAVFPAAGSKVFFPELIDEGFEPHMPKEVWCSLTLQPNTILDVTDTWDVKLKALFEHTTQIQEPDKLAERMKSRRAEDSTEENPRYEEKFRVVKYS